uniref:Protein S100-A10 n=1 Tax=Felis catus TaxID=9685 RepID=A0ABI7ZEZ0_FELCA
IPGPVGYTGCGAGRPTRRTAGLRTAPSLSKTRPERKGTAQGGGVLNHPRALERGRTCTRTLSAEAPSPPRSAHWPARPSQARVPAAPPAKVSTDLIKMPSQMEHAMETMMFTFHKFAGDKGYLTKEDLRVLMEKEFPGFLENQKDPLAVDKIMKDLDQCRDGRASHEQGKTTCSFAAMGFHLVYKERFITRC